MNTFNRDGDFLEATGDGIASAANLVAALAASGLEPKTIGAHSYAPLPPGYKMHELTEAIEKAQPTPNRKRGTMALHSVPSLLDYCADQQAQAGGYIYADLSSRTITAVFNDQRVAGTGTGWRDHRAVFKAEHTPEFQMWMNRNKQPFSQQDFAEFIEDNFADLAAEEAAQSLLRVATTIRATNQINFSSAKRLVDGQTQLVYNEVLETKAGENGELKIPQIFTIGVRIFKNDDAYALRARLKYKVGSGAITFRYELDRPERSVEDAFNGYVAQVREKSGYTVLLGSAG